MPTHTAFVRNQWYVAAWSSEVGRDLLGRTVLGEPIALYRTEEGEAVALADRCVHRRFPLSESRLDGDKVVCGYHGFTYDTTGTCVYVPGQKRIPRTARVSSYPVAELDSFVWVWIGDPGQADPGTIPRAPHLVEEGWTTVSGMEPIDGDYGLLVDNLMDLSHETYLHGGYIGTPEVAETPITTEVDQEAGVVRVSRHMPDAECPPFYARSTGIEGRIQRLQDIEYFAPCLYLLHSRISPAWQDTPLFRTEITYAITPSAPGKVYDFWAVSRNFAVEDEEVTAFLREFNHTVVMQDVDALNLLQRSLDTEPAGYQELSINIDTGALAARRILAGLAAE
ncbi:aromatic ring-hydroxylating dioxygenase subunit alpha [Streptomyces sp. NBC_01387]|uniref:aromatic ring-hydroxylating dioxygenase subunit alpha n=1 Tax=unclassified Streptomyces TaxID=2593676 RepID=UPI0020257FCB|nr:MULTISPECIES: aromatic ring-hydroxylating dioxygenase subunit alpha [unclassified Streptomyces]MCX4553731.1 aromatic ring-hydroxylating dioxygenase subunit alpha [Streptomyces sp. NBC_01500]WSC18655.1 aromatic ring-hydroxylating dioxygenase subunit alpha [Streptomyces sp. NBC_01766]WSV52689.1 aromatic ring-hydroxylating dioxygenase subunit alpha [Streptomyces sp. NBC_01014]